MSTCQKCVLKVVRVIYMVSLIYHSWYTMMDTLVTSMMTTVVRAMLCSVIGSSPLLKNAQHFFSFLNNVLMGVGYGYDLALLS